MKWIGDSGLVGIGPTWNGGPAAASTTLAFKPRLSFHRAVYFTPSLTRAIRQRSTESQIQQTQIKNERDGEQRKRKQQQQ